jgi:hypothetical protein
LWDLDVSLSASHGTTGFFNPGELTQWPSEYTAEALVPFASSPTNVGVSSGVKFQALADINVYPNHYPTPASFEGGDNYLTQPLVFDNFNVAAGEVQYGDFNAALTSTAIDFDFPGIGSGSGSASASYSLLDGNDLNGWNLPVGPSDFPGDAGNFMDGSAFTGDLQPLATDGGFVDTGFGFPTPWMLHNSMDGNFQSSIASNDAASSSQGHNDNLIWDPSPPAASMNDSSSTPIPALPDSTSVTPPPQSAVPAQLASSTPRHQCAYPPVHQGLQA